MIEPLALSDIDQVHPDKIRILWNTLALCRTNLWPADWQKYLIPWNWYPANVLLRPSQVNSKQFSLFISTSFYWTLAMLPWYHIQWNLSWETNDMRDHLSWQITHFLQKDLHFNITEPVTRDHLSWQATFWGQWGGSTRQVLLYNWATDQQIMIHEHTPYCCLFR